MTTALDRVGQRAPVAATPDRVGQATAVEQARAVAEVQAAVMVAQQVPRNMDLAKRQMQDSCAEKALADRAFFAYTRAGSKITGPSIHLARELARCFGNVQYGINELRRDDVHHQSEMLAWAWDVQNNTRATTTFIVPHGMDLQGGGRKDLTALRDIYENNANHGARRLREQIFAILPTWFTEEAKEICQATIEAGNGEPIEKRVAEAITAFGQGGITEQQLVERVGRPPAKWTAADISQLEVLYQSLRRGETTKDEQFPAPARVTADEITGQAGPTAAKASAGKKANQGQMKHIHGLLKDRNVESDDGVRQAISTIIGRELASRRDLLETEADTVIAKLEETGPPPPDGDGVTGPAEPTGDES